VTQIVKVPFRDDEILTVEHDGKPHIVLRPAIEGLGLDYSAQYRRLQRKCWARVVVMATQDQRDGMIAVDVRTFLMLLATVDDRRVAEHIRPKLIAYQSEVADVIEAYWTRGGAFNPRATPESFFEPHTLTWDEAAALIAQRYGIPMTANQLTRTLRTAGVLKQVGGPRKEYQHLFWFTGAAWNVHPHVLPQIAQKVHDTTRELQEFRFIQYRLQLEGVGQQALERT
jgi:hypothetical protein